MSKYASFTTNIRNAVQLREALTQLGYKVEQGTMQGYGGVTINNAEAIVRKSDLFAKHPGGHFFGDLGFVRKEDGGLDAIIDDLDAGSLDALVSRQNRGALSGAWMNSVQQRYTEVNKLEWAAQQGFIFQGREEVETSTGKQVNLLFAVRD